MRRMLVVLGMMCVPLWATVPVGAEEPGALLVVDDDRAQCPGATYTSLQDAVGAAHSGGVVQVCPGTYAAPVEIDRPLTVVGPTDGLTGLDCLAPTFPAPGELDPTRFALVEAPPELDGPWVRVTSDDVDLSGLVFQGHLDEVFEPVPGGGLYDPAVTVAPDTGGVRLHHNLFRGNTLGVELGGDGAPPHRVDHNCFRDNRWGLSNQRHVLAQAMIHDNDLSGTEFLAFEIGWPYASTDHVRVYDNDIRKTGFAAIYVSTSTATVVSDNDIGGSRYGTYVRGDTQGLTMTGNTVTGGQAGILFPSAVGQRPTTQGLVAGNTVTGHTGGGIVLGPGSRVNRYAFAGNTTSRNNVGLGVNTDALAHRNEFVDHVAEGNAVVGFRIGVASTQNEVVNGVFRDNGTDAAEFNVLPDGTLGNTWTAITCDTDIPAGLIC